MDTGRDVSDPVSMWDGEFTLRQQDMFVPGIGLHFAFERFYRSRMGWSELPDASVYIAMTTTFGMPTNWSHSYCMFLFDGPLSFHSCGESPTIANHSIFFPNGEVHTFFYKECDSEGQVREWWNSRVAAKLILDDSDPELHRLILETADGTSYHFFGDSSLAEYGPFKGRLELVRDRFGNQLTFMYQTITFSTGAKLARLSQVVDTQQRVFSFTYTPTTQLDPPYQLTGVLDFTGEREVRLVPRSADASIVEPDSNPNDLLGVEYREDGVLQKSWEYTYLEGTPQSGQRSEWADLTRVISPNGEEVLRNDWYIFDPEGENEGFLRDTRVQGHIKRQVTPAGTYDYVVLSNLGEGDQVYSRVVVVNPAGQVKLFFHRMKTKKLVARFDYVGLIDPQEREAFLQGLKNRSVTLDSVNPDWPQTAYLHKQRQSDPGFRKTQYQFSPYTGRYGGATDQDGSRVEVEYEQNDLLPGGDPFRTANMTRRRQIPPDGSSLPVIEEEWKYQYSQGGSGCGCASGFASEYKDGNGNVTKYARNPDNGQLLQVQYGWNESAQTAEATESYTYDSRGRMLSHTHPDNGSGHARVDEYEYFPDSDTNLARRGLLKKVVVDAEGVAPLNLTTEYNYDDYGNVSWVKDANGNITEYINDFRGLVIEERRLDSAQNVLAQTNYTYRADDVLVRVDTANLDHAGAPVAANPHWTTIYEADALGRTTRVIREAEAAAVAAAQLDGATPDNLVSDPRFQVTQYEYDGLNNLTKITKGEAIPKMAGGVLQPAAEPYNTIDRVYDDRSLLFQETRGQEGPDESWVRFDYNLDGNVSARHESVGEPGSQAFASTIYGYDDHGRLSQARLVDNTLLKVGAYDANGNRLEEVVVGPHPTDAGYNWTYLSKVTRTFDALDRPTTETRLLYDVRDATPLNPAQSVTTTVYNPDSSVHSVTDPRNNTTVYEYDTAGRLSEVEYPAAPEGASSVVYAYDNNGNTTQVTQHDAVGGTGAEQVFITKYEYDALDRMTKSIQDLNGATDNETEYRHDSRGLVVGMTDPLDNLSAYEYDGLGRLVRTTRDMNDNGPDPLEDLDLVTTQSWDQSSRLIAQTDDNGNPTRYAYDSLDRLIMTRYADGTFDQVGVDGNWAANTVRPDLSEFHSGYDVRGNVLEFRDPNGSVVTTAFDERNRPVSRSISRGTGVLGRTQEYYAYDGLSRLWRARDNYTVIKRVYDSAGRMMRESFGVDEFGGFPLIPTQSVDYEHDAAGNATKITYPGGTVVDQTFDALNRLGTVKMTPSGGAQFDVASYVYAGPSRVARRAHGNGTEITYAYNGQSGAANATGDWGFRQVSQVTSFPTATPIAEIDRRTLQWDAAQNKTRLTRNIDGTLFVRTFIYDAANRLDRSTQRGVTRGDYTLDGVHNRLQVSGSIESGAQVGFYSMNTADAPVNQYTTTPWNLISYDANGNLTRLDAQASGGLMMDLGLGQTGAGPQSVYDSAAQAINLGGLEPDMTSDTQVAIDDLGVMQELVEFSGGAAGPGGGGQTQSLGGPTLPPFGAVKVASLRYDYRNQMVEYEDDEYPGEPHRFIYDLFGRRLWSSVYLYSGTGGRVSTTHCYSGNTRSAASWQVAREQSSDGAVAEYCYGNYIDEVLLMHRDPDGAGSAPAADYTYHQDDLFSVVALTDASGALAERYEYGDYGVPSVSTPAGLVIFEGSQVGNRWMFQGREWRAESRLYGFRTRCLEPTMGRFTSKDWIGVWGDSANSGARLAFVASSPCVLADPWGLKQCGPWVWALTGSWCEDDEVVDGAQDAFDNATWDRTNGTLDSLTFDTLDLSDFTGVDHTFDELERASGKCLSGCIADLGLNTALNPTPFQIKVFDGGVRDGDRPVEPSSNPVDWSPLFFDIIGDQLTNDSVPKYWEHGNGTLTPIERYNPATPRRELLKKLAKRAGGIAFLMQLRDCVQKCEKQQCGPPTE